MPVKLQWIYGEHKPGDEVSLSKTEEDRLVDGGYATRVAKEETKPASRKATDKDES